MALYEESPAGVWYCFIYSIGVNFGLPAMILKEEQAKEIVNRPRATLQPRAVYVFGSQASGAAKSGSDVDLCVIVPDDDESSYRKTVKAYRCLRDLVFPKDVIVRHQTTFETRSRWRRSIEREVLRSGKLIYKG